MIKFSYHPYGKKHITATIEELAGGAPSSFRFMATAERSDVHHSFKDVGNWRRIDYGKNPDDAMTAIETQLISIGWLPEGVIS